MYLVIYGPQYIYIHKKVREKLVQSQIRCNINQLGPSVHPTTEIQIRMEYPSDRR